MKATKQICSMALLILLFTGGIAQAQVDKASLDAVAVDASGAPVPGVTVTLVRPATGYQTIGVTDRAGVAQFLALTPDEYRVSFALQGFATPPDQSVKLRVGQTAKISVTLKPSASETITVSAESPVVDLHKTDSSTNIVPEQIESLPVADRDFQKLAFLTPGVERERGGFRFIGGGPVVGAGGNASQSTILVNGVDFTDESLGLARTRFSQDAIREFRVIADRFDTAIGGSSGGAISVVTKSGTNDTKGSVFLFDRDKALRSQGAFDLAKNDYSRQQYGFTGGGPLQRDRLFYFASGEQIDEKNVVLFRPGGAYAPLAADVSHPFNQTLLFGSVDAQFSPKQTGGVNVVYDNYSEDNFRVGGVADPSYGQTLERKNWNVTGELNSALSSVASNEARAQFGHRRFFEPTNSNTVAEWYSSGNTLMRGGNILGNLLGDGSTWEVRDTLHYHFTAGSSSHDIKAGASLQHVTDRSVIDVYKYGLFLYLTDTKALPLAYAYGVGSSDSTISTDLYGAFVEDAWRPNTNLLVNLGFRYDLDTNGNNPDFTHPLVPNGRERDTNNYQPRASFTYDVGGSGTNVIRGGAGRFTGRFLLVPALAELQQNGITGRVAFTRLNGAIFGIPALTLDPNNPTTTGIAQKASITLLSPTFKSPQSDQASLGWTTRLGDSRLYFDTEGIYVKGKDEIIIRDTNFGGNAHPARPNTTWTNINMYTNEGHSKYQALVLSMNGNVRQSDLLTASVTFAGKKNINDDFSPDFTTGYPNDPANIEAEYGRSRGTERYRIVLSGVFHAPWSVTVAPIFEYGSGQPWTERLGYDFNGDGFNSDRPAGVGRNTMNGPAFRQLSLRIAKDIPFRMGSLQAIAEGFNITNFKNLDVNSISAGEFLSGPTLANPNAAKVVNPRFGQYSATLSPREFQLGLRWSF
jgi:TonB dependent receptor/Carboxypeptidase regulatory-like domain